MKRNENLDAGFRECAQIASIGIVFLLLTGCETPEGTNAAAGLFNANAALATNPKQGLLWGILGQTAAADAQMQNQQEVARAGRPQILINGSAVTRQSTYVENEKMADGSIYTGPIEWIEPYKFRSVGRGYYQDIRSIDKTTSYTGTGLADGAIFVKDGSGTMTWENGSKYQGDWKDDKKSGRGVYADVSGTKYDGQWKDDKEEGQGVLTTTDGKKFEGEFKNDKYNGQGKYTGTNGTALVGEWREGKTWKTHGVIVYPDGTKFEGVWNHEGEKSLGTITWEDGRTYKGEWKIIDGEQDLPNGQGMLSWPDGRKYVGAFKDGKMHGVGKMTYADGKIEEGDWEMDKFAGRLATADEKTKLGSPTIKNGSVMVTADDNTLEVFIDGSFVGNVPAKLKLSEGSHVIEIKKEGFRDYRKEIKITESCELNVKPALEKN